MRQIDWKRELKTSLIVSAWFTVLLLPLMVMKVSVNLGVASVEFRWHFLPIVAVVVFVGSFLWRRMMEMAEDRAEATTQSPLARFVSERLLAPLSKPRYKWTTLAVLIAFVLVYPRLFGLYHTSIMITAMIYVILALGLNIIVGLGGLLNLGFAAFFAVGAYTYGFLWKYAGPLFQAAGWAPELLFWSALPLAGIICSVFGILLSLPVLRLRGDYLAIITLGFGEIVRMVLQNWGAVTGGATGINLIPRPWLFGLKLVPRLAIPYIYYIAFALVALTVFIVRRLEDSRVGRALEAMREDEIACQAMGIDLARNKILTFALGAFWAGIAGVLLAAQTTYINPDSFTLWESIMILMAVVIGGQGSIPGVIVGALLLKLLPEYFRPLSQYRMLIYGVAMIVIILFKPQGLIPRHRRRYVFAADTKEQA